MSELRIGKRHRKRGALYRAVAAAQARVARLAASPPLTPRRKPASDARTRIATLSTAQTVELARAITQSPERIAQASLALVHAESSLTLGDYAFVESVRTTIPPSMLLCVVDVFLDRRTLARARDAGADVVGLVARALEGGELGVLVEAARALDLGVLVECRSSEEVDAAVAVGADGVLAALLDRDRLRADPEGAAATYARADTAHLPCFDVLAPFRDAAVSTAAAAASAEAAANPAAAPPDLPSAESTANAATEPTTEEHRPT